MKSKIKKVIAIVAGAHIVVILILVFALSYPNPFKAFTVHPNPKAPFTAGIATNTPYWFFEKTNCDAVVVIAHGRSHDKSYMSPLIDAVWIQTDLCIMAIDLPSHGARSYGTTTIGPREKIGIDESLAWLREKDHRRVMLYGVSMGGSAIIHSLQKEHSIQILGYITDGTYGNLLQLVHQTGDSLFIPHYIRTIGISLVNWWVGYQLEEVRPQEHTPNIPYPYLALHGTSDPLAPVDSPTLLTVNQPNSMPIWYQGGHDEPDNTHMQSCVIQFFTLVQQDPTGWKTNFSCAGTKEQP